MPTTFQAIVMVLAGLLVAGALVFTYRRADKRRLWPRMLATAAACLALLLLWWQPRIPLALDAHTAILISPLASAHQVDSLQAALHTPVAVLALRHAHQGSTARPDVTYDHIAALLQAQPGLRTLYVVGAGLPTYALAALATVQLHAIPFSTWPLQVQLPPQLTAGLPLVVNGQAPPGTTALALYDPAGNRTDSAAGATHFSLRAAGTQAGLQHYTLRHYQGSRVQHTTLPVQVATQRPIRLAVLEQAPHPETKFLKHWAGQAGHRLWVRTAISRDRFRYDGVNQAALPLTLSHTTFAQWDLLILDTETLAALPPQTLWQLSQAVQQGLGIFLRVDERVYAQLAAGQHAIPFYNRFALAAPDTGGLRSGRLVALHTAQLLPAAAYLPGQLSLQPNQQPLLTDAAQRVVAATSLWGGGQVGISLVQAAYTWQLQGSTEAYAHYWQAVLQPLVRRQVGSLWASETHTATLHQPITLHVRGQHPQPLQITDAAGLRYTLPLAATATGDYAATYWPQQTGWHHIATTDSSVLQLYVHAQLPTWGLWAMYQRTQFAALRPHAAPPTHVAAQPAHSRPLPVAWAWALFLVAAVYLWAERKF